MKKTKLFYFILLLIIIFNYYIEYFGFPDFSELNPNDYARITDVDYKAEVVDEPNSNGKVIITEKLTFDIHAASKNNPFWELWRDLPESYVDGVKVEYNVNSVKQLLDDGSEIVYEQSPKLYWDDDDYINSEYGLGPEKWYHSKGPYNESARQYECLLFYVNGLYREKVTFEIEYEMLNASLRYNDCSELYLSMYSGETIKYLNSYKAQILFKNKDMPKENNYYIHTYGTNSNTIPFTESATLNPGYYTFSIDLDKSDLKFKPYNQYLEFALVAYGDDKNIFSKYANVNDYTYQDVLTDIKQEQEEYDNLAKKAQKDKGSALFYCILGSVLIVLFVSNIDKIMRAKNKFYTPTTQWQFFREIPSNLDPNFASALVFCKDRKSNKNRDEYSSIMLSLVRKGYIEIARIDNTKEWTHNNVKIIVKYQPTVNSNISSEETTNNTSRFEPLTLSEQHYFNLIIRHSKGTEISMKSFQNIISIDYQNTNSFVEKIDDSVVNIGVSQGYFQTSNYKSKMQNLRTLSTFMVIIGIIFLTIVNLISSQSRLDLAYGGFSILGIVFIISALYVNKISSKYILLTQFGEDEYAKWRGLYNFLNSETLLSERTLVELPLWEQYLVYATAFGISDKVIKALKIRCPNIENSYMLSNPYYYSHNFYYSSRSFRSAVRTASNRATSSYYSGYGGHGGYGGGGRGGGGGRRRSLIPLENNS